jgi:hypothetical protein
VTPGRGWGKKISNLFFSVQTKVTQASMVKSWVIKTITLKKIWELCDFPIPTFLVHTCSNSNPCPTLVKNKSVKETVSGDLVTRKNSNILTTMDISRIKDGPLIIFELSR